MSLHNPRHLTTWSPVCGTVWVGLEGGLAGGSMSLEAGFEVTKAMCHFQFASLFPA